jgi:hypothetical protein
MKKLILILFVSGTCFAFDDAEYNALKTDRQLREINDKLSDSQRRTPLSEMTPEERAVELEIQKEKLKSMQLRGVGSSGRSGGTTLSAADQQKQAQKQIEDEQYRARKQAEAAKKQAALNDANEEKKFYAAVEQSRADVARCYPQAIDPKSPLSVKSAELWKKMEAENNPLVNQADAPFIVFSMVATMLDIKPVVPR